MKNLHSRQFLNKDMSRKEFLKLLALMVASLFGAFGIISELLSHAATPYASDEAENGTQEEDAVTVTSSSASNEKAVEFGTITTTLPTTGPLYTRCSFGACCDDNGLSDSAGFAAFNNSYAGGKKFQRFNVYYDMATGTSTSNDGWPGSEATWCAANGHDLDISWDGSTGPTFASILAGGNDAAFDTFFQQAKAFPNRIFIRMWWEMTDGTGGTNPGGKLCTSTAQWVKTWQYVVNRCRITNGATNVLFTWCIGSDNTTTTSAGCTPASVYPGDDYVDELGADLYNNPSWSGGSAADWSDFATIFKNGYATLASLNATAPISVGETGTVPSPAPAGQSKATWWMNVFTSTEFPRLRNINIFSHNNGTGQDWSIQDDAATGAIFNKYMALSASSGEIGYPGEIGVSK